MGDNEVELVECVETRCEHQDSLPQEQREMVGSLEADRDQVSPVKPYEVERVSDVNGYTQSLGGMETLGFLELTRIPDANVAVCVVKCMSGASVLECVSSPSNMACVSACMGMVHGPTQTGDTSSEPGRPQMVNLAIVPGSHDGEYEVHGVFRARPSCVRLRDCDPARERSTLDTSRPRGRRKCRRVLGEFGTDGSTCERVCEAPRAARRVFCSQNARTGSPGRYARASLQGKPRRFSVRVTSLGTLRRELRASGARWLAWRTPRRRVLIVMRRSTTRLQVSSDGRDERVSRRLPPWRCNNKQTKKPLAPSTRPRPGCGKHPCLGKGALVGGKGLA